MASENNTPTLPFNPRHVSTILDEILEKAKNIEKESNSTKIKRILNDAIWLNGRRERESRNATPSIKYDDQDLTQDMIEEFFDDWSETNRKLAFGLSLDKEYVYIHFVRESDKLDFLNKEGCQQTGPLVLKLIQANIKPPNFLGEHFQRKKVRIEAGNMKQFVDIIQLKSILENMMGDMDQITDFKESKGQNQQRFRTVYFRIAQREFVILFKEHGGVIPYKKKEGKKRMRVNLHAKLNVNPMQGLYGIWPAQMQWNGLY